MSFISQKERNKRLIKLSFQILTDGVPQLNQKQIFEELNKIGIEVSQPTVNKAFNHLNELGQPSQKLLGKGLPKLVKAFTGMVFSEEKNDFIVKEKSVSNVIELVNQPLNREIEVYEKGRITLKDKLDFIQIAQKEVVEIGVSLRTLTTYFTSRNRFEYKIYIEKLLEKGINFKFYVLNPNTPIAKMYFSDRGEENRIQIIKNVIADLKTIQKEFNDLNLKGSFELFQYNHFPYHHSILIDSSFNNARMFISHYIHGIRRADCPALKFSQQGNPILFETYQKSIKMTMNQSSLVE